MADAGEGEIVATVSNILKPVAAGLFTRAGLAPAGYPAFTGYSASVTWADMNPSPGVYDWSSLEAAIALAAARGLQLRVRVLAGINAPAHVKAAAGAVGIVDQWDGTSGVAARWWMPAAVDAYRAFVTAMAARYDPNPAVLEVSASLTTTIYAEPFMRQTGSRVTRENLLAAGYTVAADRSAMQAMVDAHRAFLSTRTGVAHNPHQYVDTAGAGGVDVAWTVSMMDYERAALGARAVLQNNSLDSPGTNSAGEDAMYQAIRARGGAIAFQTLAPKRITSSSQMLGLLDYAVSLGACAVEFAPRGWQQHLTPAQASAYAARLKANASAVT